MNIKNIRDASFRMLRKLHSAGQAGVFVAYIRIVTMQFMLRYLDVRGAGLLENGTGFKIYW